MRRAFLAILVACMLGGVSVPGALAAEGGYDSGELSVALAEDSVNISMGFTGTRLSVFGIKRAPGDIAIVVRGPERRMVVRRKEQVGRLWINGESVRFRNVPVYYDLALGKPARAMAAPEALAAGGIGLDALHFEVLGRETPATAEHFREALIRTLQSRGYFPLDPEKIRFLNDDFFRADFILPANVPTGHYAVTSYLFRDGVLAATSETQLRVAQAGFSARIYRFAQNHGFAYGLCGIFLAVAAGGAAHFFLRKE